MAVSAPRVTYLDASAIVKLVVREAETDDLIRSIGDAELISSEITEIEVPRAAYLRTGEPESIARAETVLRRLNLVALDDELRREAARARPPDLRSLDAVHLVSILRLGKQIEAVVVYDRRLADAVRAAGLRVEAPGRRAGA